MFTRFLSSRSLQPDPQEFAAGSVAIVGAGCGQVDMMTVKAVRLLQVAQAIVYDSLVSHDILALAPKDCRLLYAGKRFGVVSTKQEDINALLCQLAAEGLRVVRLKGGDPHIFGRGAEEALYLAQRGIVSQFVPGISAALGCASSAGIPLTFRGVARSVTLVTGMHCDGSATEWRALIAAQSTLVFYMGKEQAFEIERSLLAAGVSHDLPIAFVTNGSRANQLVSYGCLGSLSETAASIRLAGPSLLIIGEVIKQGQLLANLLGQLTRSHHLPASVEYNAEVAYG